MSLIQTQEELDIVLDSALSSKVIALDTEFYRKNTYFPILSTIQIAFLGSAFVIDCLENFDLSKLKKVLASRHVVKVLHASSQDLMTLHQTLNVKLENVFDTQIAAMFVGYNYTPSLAELCKNILDIKLNKSLQYTNWLKRPLSENHIEYALSDVKHLEAIYERLLQQLEQLDRISWFYEDMEYLLTADESLNNWIRINHYPKNIKEYEVIRHLTLWREIEAKKLNISPSIVLKDSVIKHLSLNKKFRELDIHQLFSLNFKIDIQKEFQQIKSFNDKADLKGLLKQIINYISTSKKIPSQLIATREELISYALNPYDTSRKLNKGWRKNLLSDVLVTLINI